MNPTDGTPDLPPRATRAVIALPILAALSFAAILPQGYHYGFQDQAIWLPAIKRDLDLRLYPHDSAFFLAQTRWSVVPELVAFSVRRTHLPLDFAVFLWHLLAIFLVLLGCWQLSRRCFARPATQWAAVATLWAARLMNVTGTKLTLMDNYLHPRDLATPALLFAFVAVLDHRVRALAWLAFAAVLHPTMAAFGAFHLAIQAWKLPKQAFGRRAAAPALVCLLAPFSLLFWGPASNRAWLEVVWSRRYLFPLRWHWYEWLGVVVPLAMLAWYARVARRDGFLLVAHISRRVVLAGILGVAGAIVISVVPAFRPLVPAEPMRALHFVYLLWILLGGGLLGEHVLANRPWRWLAWLAPLCVVFFLADRLVYPASPHIEWPGRLPKNAWVEAFDWARRNTPRDALFALDPMYMRRPGEDWHGFRAFAERSMLADGVKDWAVAALTPELADQWQQQTQDLAGWEHFQRDDFLRLKRKYGVTWVVLERSRVGSAPAGAGLVCPFTNDAVAVCRIE